MGKPFKKELERVYETYNWAAEQENNNLFVFLKESERPTLIVGSGGSLSACHYLSLLLMNMGIMAKAITPLEVYYSKNILNNSNIIFLSASGKNTDIIFGFNLAIQYEPNCVISICMKKDSPLSVLSTKYSNTKIIEYNIPTRKDGFLATNSLIAFFSIFFYNLEFNINKVSLNPDPELSADLNFFFDHISKDCTFHLLYGGWGQSVAIDIESKFTEAGLGNILLSDYRNFGHGRHHWFDKRKSSAIIALVTPEEKLIAQKTLAILPDEIPRLILASDHNSPLASIELLIKSFFLADKMGEVQGIDPGKPGVPEYGRKLYHLKYSSFYSLKNSKIPQNIITAIIRKTKVKSISELKPVELKYWLNAYNNFIINLTQTNFGSLIFDFDGTLCPLKNRFKGLQNEISKELIKFLSKGFILGIITGRGRSARIELQKVIPKEYWKNVIIGYYNGSDISTLDDNNSPDKYKPTDKLITEIFEILNSYNYLYKPIFTVRPHQLTIEIENNIEWKQIKPILIHLIMKANLMNIQILESSHSIDIVSAFNISKLNIIPIIKEKATNLGLPQDSLCIGDKGLWPGNDFELLSTPFSLSVDDVSPDPKSCWNISDPGVKNDKATLEYLNKLRTVDMALKYII